MTLEDTMIAYLLGELPADEAARFEDGFVGSEMEYRQLLAVEAELYDTYASGKLSPERRRRFEQRLLATPEQIRRLQFSRALGHARRRKDLMAWGGSLGLAASVLLGIALWRFQPSPPRLPQPAAAPVVAFSLLPPSTRDAGTLAVLEIPPGARDVRISSPFTGEAGRAYRAALLRPDGVEVWTAIGLRAPIVLTIPATQLPSGHYALSIALQVPGGAPETVADYSFRVRRL